MAETREKTNEEIKIFIEKKRQEALKRRAKKANSTHSPEKKPKISVSWVSPQSHNTFGYSGVNNNNNNNNNNNINNIHNAFGCSGVNNNNNNNNHGIVNKEINSLPQTHNNNNKNNNNNIVNKSINSLP
eukprot:500594_1